VVFVRVEFPNADISDGADSHWLEWMAPSMIPTIEGTDRIASPEPDKDVKLEDVRSLSMLPLNPVLLQSAESILQIFIAVPHHVGRNSVASSASSD
jgi:hypothetical protein